MIAKLNKLDIKFLVDIEDCYQFSDTLEVNHLSGVVFARAWAYTLVEVNHLTFCTKNGLATQDY